MPDIKWSDDYELFELHPQNRLISDGAGGWIVRKDLVESMREDGFLISKHLNVQRIGGRRFRIIEGHNRFVVAKSLGIKFAYIAYTADELAGEKPGDSELSTKQWNLADYVRKFVHAGKKEYAALSEFSAATGISAVAAASLLYGQVAGSGNVNKMLKAGDFRVTDEPYAWLVASILDEIKLHASWGTSMNCVNAVSRCVFANDFDVKKFKDKIRKNAVLLEQQRSVDDYIRLFEDIYNRNCRGRKYPLCIEVKNAMQTRKTQSRDIEKAVETRQRKTQRKRGIAAH